MTKPSRAVSKGREAARGSSPRRDSAPIRSKPVTQKGCTTASEAPATAMSQAPERRSCRAVPMAVAPEAQAVTVLAPGPGHAGGW